MLPLSTDDLSHERFPQRSTGSLTETADADFIRQATLSELRAPVQMSSDEMRAGTDVAIESAEIVLVRGDPRDVVGAIALSRASYRRLVQNLVWASANNVRGGRCAVTGLPVAAALGYLEFRRYLPGVAVDALRVGNCRKLGVAGLPLQGGQFARLEGRLWPGSCLSVADRS